MNNPIEKQLDTLQVKRDDVIILKGDWEHEEVKNFATLVQSKKLRNIIVLLSDDKELETIPTENFFRMLRAIQKKREFDQGSLEFFVETSLLPQTISENGLINEEIEEAIICDSISSCSGYENNMPKELSLVRKLKSGKEHIMKYVQSPKNVISVKKHVDVKEGHVQTYYKWSCPKCGDKTSRSHDIQSGDLMRCNTCLNRFLLDKKIETRYEFNEVT